MPGIVVVPAFNKPAAFALPTPLAKAPAPDADVVAAGPSNLAFAAGPNKAEPPPVAAYKAIGNITSGLATFLTTFFNEPIIDYTL